MSRSQVAVVSLTHKAIRDLHDIFDYSRQQWGNETAQYYLDAIEAALDRLRENPELLEHIPELDSKLRCYRVNKHLLACDVSSRSVVVLTILHASMDLPARIAELRPTLHAEVTLLHQRFRKFKPR